MPDIDDDLVKGLREQLDAEKQAREELIEELRASRKQVPEPEPTPMERMRGYYEKAAKEKAAKKDGNNG